PVYPFIRNSISSGVSSSPSRLRWIKSTVRIMSNLAYHPKGLKVKARLRRSRTNQPLSGAMASDSRQFPLEVSIVHLITLPCRNRSIGLRVHPYWSKDWVLLEFLRVKVYVLEPLC